jgi:hypothetical protein
MLTDYQVLKGYAVASIILSILIFLGIILCGACHAGGFDYDRIADAIFLAENSKAHPYGVLTHYKHTTPRQACINTIKHAEKDWDGSGDFISFLGSRYAPTVNATNDPKKLNANWIRNVKYFLDKLESQE